MLQTDVTTGFLELVETADPLTIDVNKSLKIRRRRNGSASVKDILSMWKNHKHKRNATLDSVLKKIRKRVPVKGYNRGCMKDVEAVRAYDEAAKAMYGHDAVLNFPDYCVQNARLTNVSLRQMTSSSASGKSKGKEKNMASKTNEGADSSVVLTPFFDGTDFEYWKIRMRTHLKAEAIDMKNLEAKYRQYAKALSKIQMGVSRAYFATLVRLQRKLEIF
ncbi:uncharacterized protein [Solanum lycopersicum]|uniref:uncharacterized protein n=1 Tax=Solanum lycopersicum TaxID=4081 RepID=UPI0037497352